MSSMDDFNNNNELPEECNRNLKFSDPELDTIVQKVKHLDDLCRKSGKIYEGIAELVIDLTSRAYDEGYKEAEEILNYLGSAVFSVKVYSHREVFLQTICSAIQPSIVLAQFAILMGVNVNRQNRDGDTALHLTARYYSGSSDGQLNIVKILIKGGANRNIRNNGGFTPMQLSILLRNLEVAEELLNEEDKLVDVDEADRITRCRHLVKCLLKETDEWNVPHTNYSMLLHFLVFENDDEIFEYVVNNTRFDVNAVSAETGNSKLLHLVAKVGTLRMARALINAGADLDADSKNCATPLIDAIKKNQLEIFHCLVDRGASVNKVEEVDGETNSPLHYAVCLQNFEMVEKLVKLGADVNALTYHRSPLLIACGSIDSKKWCQIKGRGLSSTFYMKSGYFQHNIHDYPFSIKIVELLLDYGADIEAKNASNRTALDQACRSGKLNIVRLLLNRGAKIDQGDVSTLHHAVRGESPSIVRLILEEGADVNCRCAPEKILCDNVSSIRSPPRTPLECAVNFIRPDYICKSIIEILLEYGVKVNTSDPDRNETPLHLVCLYEKNHAPMLDLDIRAATFQLLLKSNANINAVNIFGFTPFDYVHLIYTSEKSEYPFRQISNRPERALVSTIAFVSKMLENNEHLVEKNLTLLRNETACLIYQKCINEISLMKKNICESRNFSFFNILTKDIEYLGHLLQDKEILQVLNSGKYQNNFPIYSEYLEDRIQEAKIHQELVNLTSALFQNHVYKDFFIDELFFKIYSYLSLSDIKNFAKACFVDLTGLYEGSYI